MKQNIIIADREADYEQAKRRALARLSTPYPLGGKKPPSREALHDRRNLREAPPDHAPPLVKPGSDV